MKKETNKTFKLSAILLALALLFPFTTEALHILNHHGHQHCTDNTTTHFHKHEFDCEIFDFHLTTVVNLTNDNFNPPVFSNYKTIFPHVEEFFLDKVFFQYHLRGPPHCA
jgi:hypothetical protein